MNSILSRAGGIVHSIVDSIKTIRKYETTQEDSIQVCVRVRPILRNERDDSSGWSWKDNTLSPRNIAQPSYSFDHLFYPENSNVDIFESVIKNTVFQSMQGFHGTVFTYGQTSSGKTFTMNGTQSQPGIIPQSIFYCFDSIQEHFTDREFLIRVSYLEVYNEQVKDLLSTEPTQIKIQHDSKLGTILTGVKEQVVLNSLQVIALLKAGEAHRHVGNTDMNEKSSRAHTLLKLIIESKRRGDASDAHVRVSVLNLVDLAGSENAKMTNSTGERAREAKCINQSLLTLSLIIQRLSKEKVGGPHKQYLPYRDSKLTRLLQSSLSGKAQIAIICTISPTLRCVEESHNTLKFAARAKTIKTRANVNEMMDDKTLLRAYKNEIHSLKARLAVVESQSISQMLSKADIPNSATHMRSNEAKLTSRSNEGGTDSIDENDESWYEENHPEDNESAEILQMISEMERLILKADLTPSSQIESTKSVLAPTKSNSNAKRKSFLRPPSISASTNNADMMKVKISGNKIGRNDLSDSPRKRKENLILEHTNTHLDNDHIWENIESPLVRYNLTGATDEEERTVGTTDFLHMPDLYLADDDLGRTDLNGSHDNENLPTDKSISHHSSSRKRAPSTTVLAARKFGFIPSTALSQSLIKVAKDAEDEICPKYRDDTKNVFKAPKTESDTEEMKNDVVVKDHNYEHALKCDNADSMFGVSEMLSVLKQYVEKSSTVKRRSVPNPRHSTSSTPKTISTDGDSSKNRQSVDLRLISEDYKYLVLELEKKDNLLSMLTEGLREVESSQERWLADNEMLFQELEQALEENQELSEQIIKQREELDLKDALLSKMTQDI